MSRWQRGKRLSDIEFLAIKEFQGKLREDDGTVTATGDIASLTANSGKDLYITSAKCSHRNATNAGYVTVVLKKNGTEIERCQLGAAGQPDTESYEFKNIGFKVAATQIVKIELVTEVGTAVVSGYIQGFEEDTGEDPRV